jgi:hypothetical protein
MLRIRFIISALVATGAFCVLATGCELPTPTDAEIGCAYSAQSSPLCPHEAGVPGADSGRPAAADAGASDGQVAEGGGGVSGLGTSCTSSADCTAFGADYCLISPNGGFAAFCTYTQCTVAMCGTSYGCCDCSQSPISLVNTYPAGICVPPTLASALPSYGCTCLSTGG